jgi:O-antigen ligase|tara:strand:+ start:1412 stop:1594 length:183 start_codon:yes stop_codon:yes gene_type:complete
LSRRTTLKNATSGSAHSVYLEFAAETGLIAAIIYFGMQLLIVKRCFIGAMTRRRCPEKRP